jgi:hypothetical protein
MVSNVSDIEDENREFASSPCMMHELDGDGAIAQILYLRIGESAAGFRWEVCAHDLPEPIEVSVQLFQLECDALGEGRVALERLCDHFRRY